MSALSEGMAAAVEKIAPSVVRVDGMGRGLSSKQIGSGPYISEHTVKSHVSGIYAKLGVANRAEAVSQAARRGLISL